MQALAVNGLYSLMGALAVCLIAETAILSRQACLNHGFSQRLCIDVTCRWAVRVLLKNSTGLLLLFSLLAHRCGQRLLLLKRMPAGYSGLSGAIPELARTGNTSEWQAALATPQQAFFAALLPQFSRLCGAGIGDLLNSHQICELHRTADCGECTGHIGIGPLGTSR